MRSVHDRVGARHREAEAAHIVNFDGHAKAVGWRPISSRRFRDAKSPTGVMHLSEYQSDRFNHAVAIRGDEATHFVSWRQQPMSREHHHARWSNTAAKLAKRYGWKWIGGREHQNGAVSHVYRNSSHLTVMQCNRCLDPTFRG